MLPFTRTQSNWSETVTSTEQWLRDTEKRLVESGVAVRRGGEFDRWDLDVRMGFIGSARLLQSVDDYGGGGQQLWLRLWPRLHALWTGAAATTAMAGFLAIRDSAPALGLLILGAAIGLIIWGLIEAGAAMRALADASAFRSSRD
jgi:hypothetical protein